MSEQPPLLPEKNEHARLVTLLKRSLCQQLLDIPPEADTDEKKMSHVLGSMERRAIEVLPERAKEIASLLTGLRKVKFQSTEDFITTVSQKVADYMSERYAIDEIELRMRGTLAERSGWTVLNRVLAYEVAGNEVQIHVPTVFTDSPMELVKVFDEAMSILAHRLANEPEMQNVQKISGFSGIAFENPKLMKRLGFTITEIDERRRVAHVEMRKESLVQRYAKN